MATTAQIINEVQTLLRGSQETEQFTTLRADIGPDDLAITVSSVQDQVLGVAPGIVEIDQELVYVSNVNSDGTLTIPPWGRGHAGTVATSHVRDTRMTSQPLFPRFDVLSKINQTIARVYPEVFAIRTVQTTTNNTQPRYPLDGDAQWLLDARWQDSGADKVWQQVSRWRNAPIGGSGPDYATVAVDLWDPMPPGRPLLLTYAAVPAPLVNEADDFVVTTGLQNGMRDVVALGAAAQLTTSQELSRLQLSSIEQQDRSRLVAPSAALTSSRFLEQKYMARLKEERQALMAKYPLRMEFA